MQTARFKMQRRATRALAWLLTGVLTFTTWPAPIFAASEYYGQVIFGGVAVPGATVTATQGDLRLTTSTDAQGVFRFTEIADGPWNVQIEMRGFSNLTREVTIGPEAQPAMWELSLLPFEEIARGLAPPAAPPARAPANNQTATTTRSQTSGPSAAPQTGFQRA